MAHNNPTARNSSCPQCGTRAHLPDACFCLECGASLTDAKLEFPAWLRPEPAEDSHVGMNRLALSCPECAEPMRFGFGQVCLRCGAEWVTIPRLFHPYHVRVYAKGPRADLALLGVYATWLFGMLAVLALLGKVFGTPM